MRKHSFIYTIIEEYVEVDAATKKEIKQIKLTDDKKIPGMNLTSFYDINKNLDELVNRKLGYILKSLNLKLSHCWVFIFIQYFLILSSYIPNKFFIIFFVAALVVAGIGGTVWYFFLKEEPQD